jgi:hypothetical protein
MIVLALALEDFILPQLERDFEKISKKLFIHVRR